MERWNLVSLRSLEEAGWGKGFGKRGDGGSGGEKSQAALIPLFLAF